MRGGVLLGAGINAWVAANAKDVFLWGPTLGLGGRIPLTSNDALTIGATSHFVMYVEKMYSKGVPKGRFSENYHVGAGIRIGYEHKF